MGMDTSKNVLYCCNEFTKKANDGQFEYCEDIEMWGINGCWVANVLL